MEIFFGIIMIAILGWLIYEELNADGRG